MTMVHGTVYLKDGETVIIMAEDMLTALKRATERYYGKALRVDFKTIENGILELIDGTPSRMGCKAETGCICSRCGVYIFDQSRHYCPKCGNKRC